MSKHSHGEQPASGPRALRVGYLVIEYPALCHAFIDREIRGLERRGHEVPAASIRCPDILNLLGEKGREVEGSGGTTFCSRVQGYLSAVSGSKVMI